MSKQPNILLIMADQMAAPAMGLYGNKLVKTPHIDELAKNGVVFDNCYCNLPHVRPVACVNAYSTITVLDGHV